ncbi:P-loop containing nucleoside triphosphate hydrolase [Pseudocohnilembus persalinus]|uniref:p-loop containing nucleoside triphosphate hydrolase n=1 Tax=Pseudocohnilembus persalinus TaxID=266149 RepID=A0A0V0QKN4_PSEPJ|nr:P-loop containing nucleoside triphosphate hydrolase [Pseudocohnilembus persalinus]|eukprot:KRX02756.1 P-loop containing nucleoside triphosphate hydrolase [Pseudocohnilembus persalinus]
MDGQNNIDLSCSKIQNQQSFQDNNLTIPYLLEQLKQKENGQINQPVHKQSQTRDIQEKNNETRFLSQNSQELQKIQKDQQQANLQMRDYQQQVFKQCVEKNTIIFLETGTGKTFIVICLIVYFAHKNPGKKVIFLARTVILLEQQTEEIKIHLEAAIKFVENYLQQYENDNSKINEEELTLQIKEKLYTENNFDYCFPNKRHKRTRQ